MKWLIASDIHGSAYYCKELIAASEREKADKILLLGDILYHGPRNDLPRDYAPKQVIEMLNGISDKILCVRGNCDTEVDQMVLEFPILADYCVLSLDDITIYATHGHRYSENSPPPLPCKAILLGGHTHIPTCHEYKEYVYLNPGSTTIPKEGSSRSYMIYEDGVFLWKELDTGREYRCWQPV